MIMMVMMVVMSASRVQKSRIQGGGYLRREKYPSSLFSEASTIRYCCAESNIQLALHHERSACIGPVVLILNPRDSDTANGSWWACPNRR
jgi:hypothetical protein